MVNWNLAGGNAFGNALATGMQMGAQAREAAERREYKNALAGYDPANPETLKPIMAANPEVGLQLRGQVEAQQQQRQVAELTTRAQQGDPEAMAQLVGIDFDRWKALDANVRATAKERSGVLGNAALDVLNRPPEQRAQAWDAYVDRLSQDMPEIARYKGQYSEQSARSLVAQAEMIGKLHDLERPSYQAIPEGGTLVNTRDPAAVAQFGAGQANIPPPPAGFQIDGGQTATPSATFSGSFRGLDGERVTSTFRDPARNRAVGGVSNSYHMRRTADGKPMARDSVPPPGMSMSAYHRELKRLNPDLDVINEGDHVHMEPRG